MAGQDIGRQFLSKKIASHNRISKILDIGCGDGTDIKIYIEMGFTNVTGIEPSQDFRNHAHHKNLIKDGSFENLPIPNNSVTVATARFSLHYCKNLKTAFQEVARVLTDDGKFYAVISHPTADAKEPLNKDETVTITLFNGTMPITYPIHTLDDYKKAAKNAGLKLNIEKEYCGIEVDRGKNREVNSICFSATLK